MQSKNEYHTGFVFARKNIMSRLQFEIMENYLIRRGRPIENLIENFVKSTFSDHLGIEEILFNMPKSDLSPSEKIRLLAPEMEYLLKQFKYFVTDDFIDHELLQIDSTPILYSDIPSLVNKKYIFSQHRTIKLLQQYFFNPNSILVTRKNHENRKTFFQVLLKEKVLISDFEHYQQPHLDQLLHDGHLNINENGTIEMANSIMVFIAGELRKNGNLSYWHFPSFIQSEIDRFIDNGLLEISNKLFTTDEVSYLNFFMNMKEFSNGMDLRNKYLHGSNNRSLEQQKLDYLYFLRTFILVLLKLKDDMTLNGLVH